MVKAYTSESGFDKNISVTDLKLDVFGPKEDMFYSTFPVLVKNIRRGNTIITKTDPDTNEKSHYIGRKGLMKFFDMRLNFVSKNDRDCLGDTHNEQSHHTH